MIEPCDIILDLTCVLPMLETMQNVSKMAQGRNTFVYDLVIKMILCTNDLYAMHIDPLKKYDHPQFAYSMTWCTMCDVLHMVWYLEPHTIVEYVTFQFHGQILFMLHKTCPTTGVMSMVTKGD
jgi:hypothetical protein